MLTTHNKQTNNTNIHFCLFFQKQEAAEIIAITSNGISDVIWQFVYVLSLLLYSTLMMVAEATEIFW
jgi:hypothetical protein